MAGLGAAWHFKKHARAGQRCLVLDNHPIFGGEAKENEFMVNGQTLIAPQGANGFFVPPHAEDPEKASGDSRYYSEFNIPRDLPYADWSAENKPLDFCRDNFGFMHWLLETHTSMGYFYENDSGGQWSRDIWRNNLKGAPLSDSVKASLLKWHQSRSENLDDDAAMMRLDSMSYKQFLENELNLGPEGSAEADVFMASAFGLGSDACSAYVAHNVRMPGMLSQKHYEEGSPPRNSFPGGNSGFARYFLKSIKPDAIKGKMEFNDIITGAINFPAMDRSIDQIRIRLGATVVSVRHEGKPEAAGSARVSYTKDGKTHTIRAKTVVMASGGWINKYVVRDMPEETHAAYNEFQHAPFLVANVALSNWRFMYELGITGARWYKGFGKTANIRLPMQVGRHRPAIDPDKPAVLNFYVPFHSPGLPIRAQVIKGRAELFYTSYADYENQIRTQMTKLFGASGFNHKRDIQGIVLNRWGHAYVVPTPGFFHDTPERIAPRNIIKKGYGRIAFGHSELEGFQHWGPAADQGRRAMQQCLDLI